jgi:hypothetical protein
VNKQSRDYDEELAQLLASTRQYCQGLPLPIAPPVQDDISLVPTLTWVVESSDEHRSIRNAHS